MKITERELKRRQLTAAIMAAFLRASVSDSSAIREELKLRRIGPARLRKLILVAIAQAGLVLLFATGALAEGRDGNFWRRTDATSHFAWATGWMDGLTTTDCANFTTRFAGLSSEEVTQGLTQFYDADYRNLRISMADAALLVARYSRDGMSSREAMEKIETLRVAH